MSPQVTEREDPIERHLRAALDAADDGDATYHLREALQLRIAEDHDVKVRR